MNIQAILIPALLLMMNCENNKSAKKIQTNFEAAFTKVKEISLDSNTVFDIRYIDVNAEKDLLITNRPRTEVFLYDSLGKLKARLSEKLDKEFPGGNWAPTQAYFFKNGEIFVANRVPWGIKFDREGNFKNFMPEEYEGTADLAFDKSNNIYSLNNNYRGFFIANYDSFGNGFAQIHNIDSSFINIMSRSIIGNNLLVAGNHLFYKNIAKPDVYKYNLSGDLVDAFSEQPAYYKNPHKDIQVHKSAEGINKRELSQSVFQFARKYTANYSIHHLENELLLVQYVNMGGKYGHQVLTTEGEYVLDYDLYSSNKIYAAKDGYAYVLAVNDTTSPRIDVYQFEK